MMTKNKTAVFKCILLITILSFAIRFLYYCHVPTVLFTADSWGYYGHAWRMFDQNLFVDEYRPPVYTLFLNLPMMAMGKYKAPVFSREFNRSMFVISLIQSALGIIGLVMLYRMLLNLKISKFKSCLFSLFMGSNIMLFAAEKAILTESLATFFLITASLLLIKILKKPQTYLFILLLPAFLFGLFLKPLYIIFPFVTLPIIVFYHHKRRVFLLSFLILIFTLAAVFTYIHENDIHNDYRGFSRIGDIDLLGQILYFNLPVESAGDSVYFYNNVKDFRTTGKVDPMPFRFLEYYDGGIYADKEKLNRLSSFNFKVISASFPQFALKTLSQIPAAITAGNDIVAISTKTDNRLLNVLFDSLFCLFRLLQYLTFIALPAFPATLFIFLKKPTLHGAILTLVGTIAVFQIVFTVPFVYDDFGRLLSVTQPQLYFFSFYWWGKIISNIKYQNRLKIKIKRKI